MRLDRVFIDQYILTVIDLTSYLSHSENRNLDMTGNELKALRKSKKLQAQHLSDILGIGRASLYRYEQMEEVPALVKYAACFILGQIIIETVSISRKRKVVVNQLGLTRSTGVVVEQAAPTRLGRLNKKGDTGFVPSY